VAVDYISNLLYVIEELLWDALLIINFEEKTFLTMFENPAGYKSPHSIIVDPENG